MSVGSLSPSILGCLSCFLGQGPLETELGLVGESSP